MLVPFLSAPPMAALAPMPCPRFSSAPIPPMAAPLSPASHADVCSIDKLGHMQITDRSKDVVKSGGIYPNRGGGRGIILAPANSGWVLAGSVRGRLGACLPSSSHIPNPYTQELVAASASTTAVLTPLAACMHVHSQAASGSARLRLRTLPWGTPRWQRQPSLPSPMPSERKSGEGGT